MIGSMGLSTLPGLTAKLNEPRDPEPPFKDEEVFLWEEGSSNEGSNPKYRPKIKIYYPSTVYQDKNKKQAAVLICPGGGYHIQAYHEGEPFARLFALHGIVGVVLTYRVNPDRWPGSYSDATRAMRILRSNADKYGIDPDRIGIMGFSAGGHLASTVATQPELYKNPEDDLAEQFSARPNRAILGYPVISFTDFAHSGSAKSLLTEDPDPKMLDQLSNHRHVSENTPPSFLVHAADDKGVPVQNSLMYANACLERNIPVELHVYPEGGHGFGMALNHPRLKIWSENLISWLSDWTYKMT